MSKEQSRDAARRLVESIRSQAELFESIPPAQLRALIRSLDDELPVDLETCEISMTLRLSQWAATDKEAMGLLGPLVSWFACTIRRIVPPLGGRVSR